MVSIRSSCLYVQLTLDITNLDVRSKFFITILPLHIIYIFNKLQNAIDGSTDRRCFAIATSAII